MRKKGGGRGKERGREEERMRGGREKEKEEGRREQRG